MLQLFTVIFRETIEIAIILSIVFAATKDLKNRYMYIGIGACLGVIGTIILAISADKILDLFNGYGQELVNAIILLVAAFAIIYTIVWMKHSTKKTKEQINESLLSLTLITALALLREGSEMVLFSYGILSSSNEQLTHLVFAGISGFILAAILGILMYNGIVVFSGKYIFKITSLLLSLVSAGMVAQAVNLLVAGQIIDVNQTPLWDTTWLIPQTSIWGTILHSLTGYVDNPTTIELCAYLGTILVIYIFSKPDVQRNSKQ